MTSEQIVQPGQIEGELVKIWDSLQGTNKMRACLFNLIIYSRKDKRSEYLYEVAQEVISKFPSRVIFITGEENSQEPYLKTSVSVLSAQEGENIIVCDFINIVYGGEDKIRIPFVVLPHILPDLPIYLLWGDDPAKENPLAIALEELATRIIFDSESTDHLPKFAKAVLDHMQQFHADIADLNWARIEGWRDLLKETFYAKDRLEDLEKAEKISIRFNSVKTEYFCHTRIQAAYLQGWLAARLNWTFDSISKKAETLAFHYKKNSGASVLFELIPDQLQSLRPGRIISVEILGNGKKYAFRRRAKDSYQILTEISTQEQCEMPSHYIMEKDTSGQSLVREICHKGYSKHYVQLLKVLSTIKEEGIC